MLQPKQNNFYLDGDDLEIDEMDGYTTGIFVLAVGYTDNSFELLDPTPTHIPGRHGRYLIDAERLITATLIWDGMVLEIYG